jgi:site-specific recombinase XerD
MRTEQLPLFPSVPAKAETTPPVATPPGLTGESSLASAIGAYHEHMLRQGFSPHTITAYRSDLGLVSKYVGATTPVGTINTKTLQDYLTWLVYYRGVPCNPKSFHRRITSLKTFFNWLRETGVIRRDPAAPIPQERPSSPMPEILYDAEVDRLLATARLHRDAPDKPDVRPYLIVSLVLTTGIKKAECLAIRLEHIDLSDPKHPVLFVRYDKPQHRHKERKLRLPPDFAETLATYRAEYQPKERLFECTARNLEYVLTDLANQAGVSGVTFETLRMTCAVRDAQAGMPMDALRQKLGLSEITWATTGEKIQKLAGPAL